MKHIHSYQVLVDNNLAPSLESLLGYKSELLFPELQNDKIIFKGIETKTIIYPGYQTIEKIFFYIEKNIYFLNKIK